MSDMWDAVARPKVAKTATRRVTALNWQQVGESYWGTTPHDFGNGCFANIHAENGEYRLTVLLADGGDYESDTVLSSTPYPTLAEAQAAGEAASKSNPRSASKTAASPDWYQAGEAMMIDSRDGSGDYGWVADVAGGTEWFVLNSSGAEVWSGKEATMVDAKARVEYGLARRAAGERWSSKTASDPDLDGQAIAQPTGQWEDADLVDESMWTQAAVVNPNYVHHANRHLALPGDTNAKPSGANPQVPTLGLDDSAMFEPDEIKEFTGPEGAAAGKSARRTSSTRCVFCKKPIKYMEDSFGGAWTHPTSGGYSQQCQDGSGNLADDDPNAVPANADDAWYDAHGYRSIGARKTATVIESATWADGFGNWHARITQSGTGDAAEAQARAKELILMELRSRGTIDARAFSVELVSRTSQFGELHSEFVERWASDRTGSRTGAWNEGTEWVDSTEIKVGDVLRFPPFGENRIVPVGDWPVIDVSVGPYLNSPDQLFITVDTGAGGPRKFGPGRGDRSTRVVTRMSSRTAGGRLTGMRCPECDSADNIRDAVEFLGDTYAGNLYCKDCGATFTPIEARSASHTAADAQGDWLLRVRNTNRSLEEIQRYLYDNMTASQVEDGTIYIQGHDVAGFTMDAIRDRLLSGMIGTDIVERDPDQGVKWASRRTAGVDLSSVFASEADAEIGLEEFLSTRPNWRGRAHIMPDGNGGFQLAIRDAMAPILPFSSSRTAAQITDSTRSFTLAPGEENWIGNFTDEALAEMEAFWSSADGAAAQPYMPGYADGTLKLIRDEKTRRTSSRTAAAPPTGRSDYNVHDGPRDGRPALQLDPSVYSNEDIMAEIKMLRRMNDKYGENTLRTLVIVRLNGVLRDRGYVGYK